MDIELMKERFYRIVHGARTAIEAEWQHYHTIRAALATLGEKRVLKLINSALRRNAIKKAVVRAGRRKEEG